MKVEFVLIVAWPRHFMGSDHTSAGTVQEAESKLRMVLGFWNLLDLLAFLPPLLESCLLYAANMPFNLGRFDLRWFKILR